MTAAHLHRRLTAGMGLSALAAYAAGAGWTADVMVAAAALGVAIARPPSPRWSVVIERATRILILGLCAWMLYVAFVLSADFMPAVMAMLLLLLGGESLRSLDTRNDGRLYLLSFSLLVAATAFYPGLPFAAAFVAFIVLTTLAMMAGHLRRQAERFHAPDVRVSRRMAGGVAALSAVTLTVAVGLFILFPRLPRTWNVQGRNGGAVTMAGFSDEVRLGQLGGRLSSNPEVALRVEFPEGAPANADRMHWRGRSFDRFDGERWTRTRGLPGPAMSGPAYLARWGGTPQRARIFGGPEGADVLFGPHPVLAVQPKSAIRAFQEPSGDILYFGTDVPVYTVFYGRERPSDEQIRAQLRPDSRLLTPYLQTPRFSPAMQRLADSLTAPYPERMDKARAVERYFRENYGYTLDLPRTRDEGTVEGFIFRRREAHCEYFSTAMVMLLRTAGVPARNVTGFLGGEWNPTGGYLAVTGNDAHSWVEVWFGGLGWVTFDPTPPSRDDLVNRETGDAWAWPLRFWFDGMEHRWYRWVLDYDLDKQLGMARRLGDLFERNRAEAFGADGKRAPFRAPPLVPVAVALAVAAAAVVWMRRGRTGPRSPEQRAYLALRRVYARSGVQGGGPLQFAERLARDRAPGWRPAGELVRLYLRARFAGEQIGDAGRARIRDALAEARAEVRAARRGGAGPGASASAPAAREREHAGV
ncbi:MAG TPA: transglutaminaseTgpA domain-containing protein [Longimicrobium sp.]|jgi:transglutaminase-like putative cysteine protease/uncharacterized membrane protein|uniref:transglutaminase TgpA family protein n=1 Tax=Longimicrobium sp. TaxID=2029185 RepID=UPI002ED8A9B1